MFNKSYPPLSTILKMWMSLWKKHPLRKKVNKVDNSVNFHRSYPH